MNATDIDCGREPHFNRLQTLKRRFFAMRNGVIADTLRRAGSKFRIIFGLNIPQLVEIATDYGHDPQLAETLWNNTSTRESRLLAPMLLQPADVDLARLISMASEIDDIELADHFCHRLVRRHPAATEFAAALINSPRDFDRYIALRVYLNQLATLVPGCKPDMALDDLRQIAENEMSHYVPLTRLLAARIIEEVDFHLSSYEPNISAGDA